MLLMEDRSFIHELKACLVYVKEGEKLLSVIKQIDKYGLQVCALITLDVKIYFCRSLSQNGP